MRDSGFYFVKELPSIYYPFGRWDIAYWDSDMEFWTRNYRENLYYDNEFTEIGNKIELPE